MVFLSGMWSVLKLMEEFVRCDTIFLAWTCLNRGIHLSTTVECYHWRNTPDLLSSSWLKFQFFSLTSCKHFCYIFKMKPVWVWVCLFFEIFRHSLMTNFPFCSKLFTFFLFMQSKNVAYSSGNDRLRAFYMTGYLRHNLSSILCATVRLGCDAALRSRVVQ